MKGGVRPWRSAASGSLTKRLVKYVVLLLFALVAGLAAFVADRSFHQQIASKALDEAGYGERAFLTERITSRCGATEWTTYFLAQGGRVGGETQGFVCSGYFSPATIHLLPIEDHSVVW